MYAKAFQLTIETDLQIQIANFDLCSLKEYVTARVYLKICEGNILLHLMIYFFSDTS